MSRKKKIEEVVDSVNVEDTVEEKKEDKSKKASTKKADKKKKEAEVKETKAKDKKAKKTETKKQTKTKSKEDNITTEVPLTIYRGPGFGFAEKPFIGTFTVTGEAIDGFLPVKFVRPGIGECQGFLFTSDS